MEILTVFWSMKKKEENYYKPVRVNNFWRNNYIYKSNGDKNKILSVEEYLNKIIAKVSQIISKNLTRRKFN